MKVRNILATKGGRVITIAPEETVRRAGALPVGNRIGAVGGSAPAGKQGGVPSQRDVMRAAAQDEGVFGQPVSAIMTREVVIGMPEDDVLAVAHTMLEKRFRHLPIVDEGRLIGIISIGDVLKTQRDAYQGEIDTLETRIIAAGE